MSAVMAKNVNATHFIAFITAITIVLSAQGQENPDISRGDPAALLAECIRIQSSTVRSRIHVSVSCEYEGNLSDDERGNFRADWVCLRDGDLMDIDGSIQYFGSHAAESVNLRAIINRNVYLTYGSKLASSSPPRGGVASRVLSPHRNTILESHLYGYVLDGFAAASGGRKLAELLEAKGDWTATGTKDNGVTIAGKVSSGTVELHLDRSGRMIGYTLAKGAEDPWFIGTTLATAHPIGMIRRDSGEPLEGERKLKNWVADLKNITYSGEGVPVATSGILNLTWEFTDGNKMSKVFDIKRTTVDLSPTFDSDRDFIPTGLPNGALLTDAEVPDAGVIYVWRDGEMQTGFSGFVDESKPKGVSNPPWRFRFLIILNITLVVVFGFLILVRGKLSRQA